VSSIEQSITDQTSDIQKAFELFDAIEGMDGPWTEEHNVITVQSRNQQIDGHSIDHRRALYDPTFHTYRVVPNRFGTSDVIQAIKYQVLPGESDDMQLPYYRRHIGFPGRGNLSIRGLIGAPAVVLHEPTGGDVPRFDRRFEIGAFCMRIGDEADTQFIYRHMQIARGLGSAQKLIRVLEKLASRPEGVN